MAIQNANSSGQGTDPFHNNNPLHGIITGFGYAYSHSTPVVHGEYRLIHHTYKLGEHNVGVYEYPGEYHARWDTSVSCASGRQTQGYGHNSLVKHLRSKRNRYKELR